MKLYPAVAACTLLLGCGHHSPSLTVYYRTSLRRVEVSKQVSPSSLYALAVRAVPEEVDVHLKRVNRVTLRRILHYNSAAIIYDHSGSILNEVTEFGFGLLTLVLWPVLSRVMAAAIWSAKPEIKYTPDIKAVRHGSYLRALFDPERSVFINNIRVEPLVRPQIFSDAPIVREYEIRFPASEVPVAFRILDEAGHALAQGSATTDPYGELQIRGALEHAVAVELSSDGSMFVVPIQSSATPVTAKPVEPVAMPRVRANTMLVNGWAKRKTDRPLPRLTLMIDVWRLPTSHLTVFGEVRLHRKLSMGGLFQREPITYESPSGTRETQLNEVGGYLRYYVRGNAATGIHLGLEHLRSLNEVAPGLGTLAPVSYGLSVGYKRTIACGRTFEIMLAQRYRTSAYSPIPIDPDTDMEKGDVHLNVGWSF